MKKSIGIGIMFFAIVGCSALGIQTKVEDVRQKALREMEKAACASVLTPKQEARIDAGIEKTREMICKQPEPLRSEMISELVAKKILHPDICS